jgi:leucyl-tRNA synthetase
VRDRIKVPLDATNEQLEAAALANEKVKSAVDSRTIHKVVVVPKKLVNVVAA